MKLRLYTYLEPEVRAQSDEIPVSAIHSPDMQHFFDDLVQAMITYDGIGIAAPQVGRTIQAIVIDKEYAQTPEHVVLINPRIVSQSEKTSIVEEGCLSVPGKRSHHRPYGPVERAAKVRVKALDRTGSPVDIKARGMFARVLQHEVDHLSGTVFIDKAPSLSEEIETHSL